MLQVLGDQRILLRKVGQNVGEPAVKRAAVILFDGVRISDGRIVVISIDVARRRAVQPSGCRLRARPRMLGSHVVRHHVQQDLDSLLVGRSYELLKFRNRSEVIFNRIKIGGPVSVISLGGVVVVEDGVKPQRRNAEVFQVRQVILNALEVTAVICLWRITIVGAWRRSVRHIVRRVAVGKAVGHDEVDDVVASDTLKASLLRQTGEQRK